jgi:hypothetical protein
MVYSPVNRISTSGPRNPKLDSTLPLLISAARRGTTALRFILAMFALLTEVMDSTSQQRAGSLNLAQLPVSAPRQIEENQHWHEYKR